MRIILTGFGAVGQNLVKILRDENERFVHSYGFKPSIVAVSDSRGYCIDENGLDLITLLKTKKEHGTVARYPGKGKKDAGTKSIINEVDAEVLVEATPTNFHDGEPGLSNIKTALASGKHVVTTNKGPLAVAMPALLELAQHKDLRFRFSGTVGAGTPFLDFANKCLASDSITGVRGILNGTTNNKKVKLIGSLDQSIASVKFEEASLTDPVCVPGIMNALSYSTMHTGQVTLIGPGAGGAQTASAVIRDLVDIRGEYIA